MNDFNSDSEGEAESMQAFDTRNAAFQARAHKQNPKLAKKSHDFKTMQRYNKRAGEKQAREEQREL